VLERDRDAVLGKLPGYKKIMPSDYVYFLADLPVTSPDGSTGFYRIVVTQLLRISRQETMIQVADAIELWKPSRLIIAGTAQGVVSGPGDILVSKRILDYELKEDGQLQWQVLPADTRLVGAAMNLSDDDWRQSVKLAESKG